MLPRSINCGISLDSVQILLQLMRITHDLESCGDLSQEIWSHQTLTCHS